MSGSVALPCITLLNANHVLAFNIGDVLRLSATPDRDPRIGHLAVTKVDRESGAVYVDAEIRAAIPTACPDDYVWIDSEGRSSRIDFAAEIGVLEAMLLSCVRRRDWHGVSDVANDIRVLEAVRDAERIPR